MSHNKVTINNNQFKALLVCTTWPTVINYGSGILAREIGRDMWISGAISVLSTLLFIYIIVYIGQNFPGKTIVEYCQDLLWTIPGKLLGFVLAIYFLVSAASNVSMYIHHLTDFLLPETPFLVVTVLHVAVICYLVSKGPEVIARMGVIGFALASVFLFMVFLASVSETDFKRLMPFFDSGILKVSIASLKVDSFIGIDQIIIAMILPLVSNQKKAFRSAAAGLSIGGFFFVFYFIVELMVMGPQVVALMRIASMDFVRSIQITQYLHRFESFMVALWYWSMLVQGGILTYCSQKAFVQTTGIKKEKTKTILIFIFGIFLATLTYFIASNRVFFLNFREDTWHYFGLPIQYGLPVILLLILAIRKVFHAVKN
ncbi:endospore germination permease [Bacillota bacterium LX-D]|nr:endospore germination permease [Bacillota bacterium LX-D]